MLAFFSAIHVLLCIFMIFVILLQPGKDAGMGAALGGGAATSAFGGRGAVTFLSKVTAASAVAFFLTSLGLSFVGLRSSVATTIAEEAASAPAAPAPAVPTTSTPAGTEAAAPAPAVPAPTNPSAGQGNPEAAPGLPTPTEQKPGATDAVPAEKLPPHP
ncbi:MAG: preprotein translocase subunit SecG [Myxococcota bacterium]|jgi:preprotein translocase subunit SecG